tara:strand:+ start:2803 stop:4659 length:1857 start_codon:yes stop_codon:yes gene_type:complete
MAKITRSKLARGAKLLAKHLFEPMTLSQTQATTANLESEQVSAPYAPFRVNLSMPVLSPSTNTTIGPKSEREIPGAVVRPGRAFHGIPFMLPPFQEHLSFAATPRGGKSVTPSDDMPEIVLDEVSFSFDQRLEAAAIVSNFDGGTSAASANAGKLSYERVDRLNIDLSIVEKKPVWFDPPAQSTNYRAGRVVWSGRVEAITQLAGDYFRLNPWVSSSINEVIDPMKSYIFTVSAPDLSTLNTECALVSVEISMRFLSRLTQRDSGTDIQNIPKRHDGLPNDNLTHANAGTTGAGTNSATSRAFIDVANVPVAGEAIVANDAVKGVQTSMAVIDEMSRRKLQGGYKLDSDLPMLEEMKDTAAYTVLAVPLFNNVEFSGMAARYFDMQPYRTSGAASNKFAIDRRYIPIEAPMTIHHILFTYSWMEFKSYHAGGPTLITHSQIASVAGAGGGSTTLNLELGVGIGRGVRGDSFGYQQIGKATTLASPQVGGAWFANAVDLIGHGSPSTLPHTLPIPTIATTRPWNLELHAMDLVGTGSPSLNGMTSQGKPVFVGRGDSTTSSRQDVDGGASNVAGCEQWIEVRGRIGDPSASVTGTYEPNSMLLGSGGIWVYIIGKTHLV